MAAKSRRRDAPGRSQGGGWPDLPSPDELKRRRLEAAIRLDEVLVEEHEAKAWLRRGRGRLVELEAQRLAGEITRQPEEERALRLANDKTEVEVVCRLLGLTVGICLVAVTLILIALESTGGTSLSSYWLWSARQLGRW